MFDSPSPVLHLLCTHASWHVTDAESMPIESTTFPSLATKGAFSPTAIYSTAQVKDIIAYAKARGIRVMPVRVRLHASRLILQHN